MIKVQQCRIANNQCLAIAIIDAPVHTGLRISGLFDTIAAVHGSGIDLVVCSTVVGWV
jgi:hypothetical protein